MKKNVLLGSLFHPSKPIIETHIKGNQEENAIEVEPKDSESEEEDEAKSS